MSLEAFYGAMLKKGGKWYENSNFWNKKPQTHFDYTNIGASLAAYIVEIVAKKANLADSYHAFVRSHVLAPLGVTNAGYMVSDFGGEAKLAPPAGAIPSFYKKRQGKFQSYCFYGFPDYPDGSFKASALDYARVFGAFINDGSFQGTQLLKKTTTDYMKQHTGAPCTPLPCGDDLPQGNAFYYFEKQAGRTMLGHNGGEMGIATEAFFNVKTGVGYVVLTNGDWDMPQSFSNAFAAIEEKLLSTFDTSDASYSEAAATPKVVRGRRLPGEGASGCPCGLPCNGVSNTSVLV
jgi:CubicO group peptidase (beta-lactamase class C family)